MSCSRLGLLVATIAACDAKPTLVYDTANPNTGTAGFDGKVHVVSRGVSIWETGDAETWIACLSSSGDSFRFHTSHIAELAWPGYGDGWTCALDEMEHE